MSIRDLQPDSEPTAEQLGLVQKLSAGEVEAIDQALLANTTHNFRKVARVVGTTKTAAPCRVAGIPDVYYSQRIQKLVSKGLLESQGNLSHMRYSEVRRPLKNDA